MSEHDISPPFRIAVNSTGLHCNGWQSAEVKPWEATKHVGPVGRALAKLVSDYFWFQRIGDSQQIKPTWSCMLYFCGGIQWCWGTHSEKQHLEKTEKKKIWFNYNYVQFVKWSRTLISNFSFYKKTHVESSISSSLIRQLIWKESVLVQFASLLGAPRCSTVLPKPDPRHSRFGLA